MIDENKNKCSLTCDHFFNKKIVPYRHVSFDWQSKDRRKKKKSLVWTRHNSLKPEPSIYLPIKIQDQKISTIIDSEAHQSLVAASAVDKIGRKINRNNIRDSAPSPSPGVPSLPATGGHQQQQHIKAISGYGNKIIHTIRSVNLTMFIAGLYYEHLFNVVKGEHIKDKIILRFDFMRSNGMQINMSEKVKINYPNQAKVYTKFE